MKGQWSHHYFQWLIRNRSWFNVTILAVTLLSGWAASRLELKTSFSELLPESLPSVKALNQAAERLGGTSFLSVGVESPDFEANRKFVEDMAKKLDPLVGSSIRFFEYKYDDVLDFVHKFGLQYLSYDNLSRMADDLRNEIEEGKDAAIGLGLTRALRQNGSSIMTNYRRIWIRSSSHI
jgi:uncharacterized protein